MDDKISGVSRHDPTLNAQYTVGINEAAEIAWAEDFVTAHGWRYAKTYANTTPHEYIVKTTLPFSEHCDFERLVRIIRHWGYAEAFYRTHFYYLNLSGKKYWTMNEAEQGVIIINRTEIRNRYGES